MTDDQEQDERTNGEKELLDALEAGDLQIGDFMNACAVVVRLGVQQAMAMQHLRVTREAQRTAKRWRQFFRSWNETMTTARDVALKREARAADQGPLPEEATCETCGNELAIVPKTSAPPAGTVIVLVAAGRELPDDKPPICDDCRKIIREAVDRGVITADAKLAFRPREDG